MGHAQRDKNRDKMSAEKIPPTFGAWVRARRRQLDLTQAELGKRAGCSEAAIRKIEADERKPSRQLAELLARALEIPADRAETFLQFARGTLVEEIRIEAKKHPNNLPALLTSTINRTRDLGNVLAMLKDPGVRLVTLIGPPGIGKTHLSIHCGDELLDDFTDGVWFVDLADLTNADFFLTTLARFLPTLNLPPSPNLDQLLSRLKDKRLLLILDNFEQIVEGAAMDVAQLLKTCPNLKILVTSRVPLHIYGENEYPLPPLSIPPRDAKPDALMQFESVQLFAARVRQHQPEFSLTKENADAVIEICTLLDGIPLALELAAATLRRMSLEEMVSLLRSQGWVRQIAAPARDLPQRQRTLENVIDWSFALLDDGQKDFFRKLGVFNGWFDADAASAVCETPAQPFLNALTDHSLLVREIVHGKTHWRMLELIHEYASSKQTAEVRAKVELLRAEHFLQQMQGLIQSASREVQEQYFLTNLSNFQHAVKWAIDTKQTDLSVSFISMLLAYWETLGYFKEGLDAVTRFLHSDVILDPHRRAFLLSAASTLAWHQHEFETALVYAKEAVAQERENPLNRNLLGRIYIEQGKFEEARIALEECLAVMQKHPNFNPGMPLAQLGEVYLFQGSLTEARTMLEKALSVLEEENAIFQAMAKTDLAEVEMAEGNLEDAKVWLKAAYPHVSQHVRRFVVFLCALCEYLILKHEEPVKVVRLLAAIQSLSERSSIGLNPFYRNRIQQRLGEMRKRVPPHVWEQAMSAGESLSRADMLKESAAYLENSPQ